MINDEKPFKRQMSVNEITLQNGTKKNLSNHKNESPCTLTLSKGLLFRKKKV